MGTKHDTLTEGELSQHAVNEDVMIALANIEAETGKAKSEIRVLDWGCGRGRSVAKLREMGFQAYGVEIDQKVLEKGFDLFRSRGLEPAKLLIEVERASEFFNEPFDLIFSEQVFEHVSDLVSVAKVMSKLTLPGGTGLHAYPSRRAVVEDHLFMPCVHWLPKRSIRKTAIRLMLALGVGPKSGWPEILDKSKRIQVDAFYAYLHNKTFYRDNLEIESIFQQVGFKTEVRLRGRIHWIFRIFAPNSWRRNGFPNRASLLVLKRTA